MRASIFLTASETANYLRIKISTLYSWVHNKKIPYRKHVGKLVFSKEDLEEWSSKNSIVILNNGVLTLEEVTKNCYNKSLKSDSLTWKKKLKGAHQQSTLYDPFEERESS